MRSLPIHIVLLWITVIAVSMIWIDQPLALWVNNTNTEASLRVGRWLEEIGKSHWILGYSLTVIAIAWRGQRNMAQSHLRLFSAVAASGIIANIIKVVACRPRPPLFIEKSVTAWQPLGLHVDFLWNSFPSGHATTGLAIAIAGSAAYPRLQPLFWFVGIAIALGRIMVNAHYLSDVLAGSLIGTITALWFADRLSVAKSQTELIQSRIRDAA